jgi:geranylgeranyl diphosphate synthase type II
VSIASIESLDTYLDRQRGRVDRELARLLAEGSTAPPPLDEAMRYSIMAGGKRIRPILALAVAEAVAPGDPQATGLALPAACAIEFIHTYSLIHDDLPAMDNDTLRRGRPTSHVVFGEGLAILAGDGLLTEAFVLLAREPVSSDPAIVARKLRTMGVIAEAAGAAGMVGGQAIDLRATGQCPTAPAFALDAEALRGMHARKTGAMIRAAASAGAIMAGASDAQVEAASAYAAEIGLAFQIVDDILDVEGDASLGKTAGKDAAAGKPTYPSLFGLDTSRRLAADACDRARAVLARAGLEGRLPEIAAWIVARRH